MKSGLFHCSIRQLRRRESRSGRRPASAVAAYDYIQRRGDFTPKKLAKSRRKSEKDEKLIFGGSFSIPAWGQDASHDASNFWKAADEFERSNGRLAIKIEVAIPREIPRERWPDLISQFCKTQLRNHPTSFAVHQGRAGDGGTNPHVHFVSTERVRDGIARSRELFFGRANSQHPERGGAKKDRAWHSKDFFRQVRKSWADCCNQMLAECNSKTRIDHRSFAERGIQKEPGEHEGPSRRAMKARGVPVRARQKEIRAAELRQIDDQIRDLKFSKANEVQLMKSKTITTDREAAAAVRRGKIALQNLPLQNPVIEIERVESWVTPPPPVFKPYVENLLHARGWQVEWLPHVATKPGQLPPFRARHPGGFEIEFRPGRATASSSSDEAIKALVYTCKQAGWKSVALSGPKEAREKMEILCKMAGIKVTNPLTTEAPGAPSPAPVDDKKGEQLHGPLYLDNPLPPVQPAKPKTKPKTKKERDEIGLDIAEKTWPRRQIEEPYLVSRRGQEEEFISTPMPHGKAREIAARRGDVLAQHHHRNDLQHEVNYVHRVMFHLATEHGVEPEKIKPDAGMRHRLSSKTIPWSSRLSEAFREFSDRTGEPIPAFVQSRIEEHARDPKAAEQQHRNPEHAATPLEPEPE